MNTIKPVKDAALYRQFAMDYRYCMACYMPEGKARFLRWPGLSNHHVVKFKRSDELTNLCRLCQRDHSLAEGLTIRENGILLPKLSLGIILTIISEELPEHFNPARLRQLYCKNLPDMEPIPAFLLEERKRWKRPQHSRWEIERD